jgi:hypothetical protein
MNSRDQWTRAFGVAGLIAMLVGAIDPLEGSVIIVVGSGLVALSSFLAHDKRHLLAYRTVVFILIAAGMAAMWGVSTVGGFGGSSGRSMWWGVLLLPYPAGWIMAMWGPGLPRWFSWLAIVVGAWYLAIPAMIFVRGPRVQLADPLILGAVGVLTIAGAVVRLRKSPA